MAATAAGVAWGGAARVTCATSWRVLKTVVANDTNRCKASAHNAAVMSEACTMDAYKAFKPVIGAKHAPSSHL